MQLDCQHVNRFETRMKAVKRSRISDLNHHLTCKICKGYFIDATTIVECLHTFCRSCIVKYLESNKYCPVCEVQVHKTKPLLSIKRDKTIQDVVYKLVPRLFHNEMQRRKDFYEKHPESKPSLLEQTVEMQYQHLLAPEESVSLTLKYFGCNGTPRYLKCPAAVSIGHLHKLIRAKYDLSSNHRVEVLINQDTLNPSLTLMDVAYIYFAKKKCPMELSYRIYECTSQKVKTDDVGKESSVDSKQNNNTWREVQLRISENGEMSITGIHEDLLNMVEGDSKSEPKEEVKVEDKPKVTKKEVPALKYIGKATTVESSTTTTTLTSLSSATTTTVFTTINSTKCSTKSDDVPPPVKVNNSSDKPIVNNNNGSDRKRKSDTAACDTEPKPKQIILNHSITFKNLSINHPLNKHSLNSRNGESDEPLNRPGTPIPKPPCYMPKTNSVLNVPKPVNKTVAPSVSTTFTPPKPKSSSPIGYKTLRDPPKSWNSQISKANLVEPKNTDLKNMRPPKFFKMRNNMPRYLGNPASGVKPMYQVQVSPDKVEKGNEIKRHSIVKIDPKTLKPISEKAPNDTSLSVPKPTPETPKPDLKINTSSVSIFNPLKNQSAKNERKSPKSPTTQSVKTIKRDSKPNLSFTPPNPFIPNLTSPTINPNQFLFPGTLPAYDPRLVAAYHSLWYGQRMAFNNAAAMATLNLDLNQRKLQEAQTSPKLLPQLPNRPNTNFPTKKTPKEPNKLDKTVEKLVQNRTKEIVRNNEILSQKSAEDNSEKDKKTISDNNKANVDATTGEGNKQHV